MRSSHQGLNLQLKATRQAMYV